MSAFGWGLIPLVAVALASAAILIVLSVRGRRDSGAGTMVAATFGIAVVWAGISVVGAVIAVLTTALSSEVLITVPVREFWAQLPKGMVLEGASATRVSGGFTSADLSISDLSAGARAGWAISQALWWLIPGAIAAMVAVACAKLRGGKPFTSTVVRMTSVTAVLVAVGGTAAAVLGDIAGSMAAYETLAWVGGEYPDVAGIEDEIAAWMPSPTTSITLPFWPLAAGLGLAVLATIFRYGARLQKDTEGLV